MSADPAGPSLDLLLDKLCRGDAAAAEQVFTAYEPYLRMVVRRQLSPSLRAKFDSVDVVQSVWADVLDGFREAGWRFADAAHLRAFLVKATQNRFIDRIRQHERALALEEPLPGDQSESAPTSPQPRPSEVAQADELWTQMLGLCPPAHRPVLELKRQGLPLAEIAARTGLHPSSVRRILYDLARQLAEKQKPAASSEVAEPCDPLADVGPFSP
jgi:RNA polymerase sigma-70 factor (ECF subfamily)